MPYVPPHLRGKQQEGAGGGDAAPVTKGKSLSDLAESSSSGGSRGGRGGFDRSGGGGGGRQAGGGFDRSGGGGGGRQGGGWGGSSHGNGAPAVPQASDGTTGSRFAPSAAGMARFEARAANAAGNGAAAGNDRRDGDNSRRGGDHRDAGGSDRFSGNGRRDGDNGDAGGRPYSTPSSISGYKYNPKGAPSRFGSAGRNQNRPLEEGEDVPGGKRLDVEDGMVYDMGPGGENACIYFQVLAPPPTPTSPPRPTTPSLPALSLPLTLILTLTLTLTLT